MRDYMKALCRRFESPSKRTEYLERKADDAHRKLSARLPERERKMLLRLTDLEAALRDEACLDSFMSGFRLAQGIQQELLADQPPYSFEAEDEKLVCEMKVREQTR